MCYFSYLEELIGEVTEGDIVEMKPVRFVKHREKDTAKCYDIGLLRKLVAFGYSFSHFFFPRPGLGETGRHTAEATHKTWERWLVSPHFHACFFMVVTHSHRPQA